MHRALLAHSSELFPFGALARALRESGATQAYGFSVVGHAFTVHEPVDLRGWHLLAASVPQAGQGVATASTRTYAADGRLVLSVEQLGLTRSAAPDPLSSPAGPGRRPAGRS